MREGTEDQVRYQLSLKGTDALLIVAAGTAFAALASAVSAADLHLAGQVAERVVATVGLMGISALAFWLGMASRETGDEAENRTPIPILVRVRVRARR
jgi:hypothetical protein